MVRLYEKIFPLNQSKLQGIQRILGTPPLQILDIGCATGELAYSLAEKGFITTGIDLDKTMIRFANESKKHPNLNFYDMDMTKIQDFFESESFDSILCLGNTLVHLPSISEILKMLKEIRRLLKPGGKVLIQILNYHRIISKKIEQLPLIDNKHLRFERFYKKSPDSNHLDFITRLIDKKDNSLSEGKVKLYPFIPEELSSALKDSDFHSVLQWDSYQKTPFKLNTSYPLIVSAVK